MKKRLMIWLLLALISPVSYSLEKFQDYELTQVLILRGII